MTAAQPEVVVIGGGPAGATAATILAQKGRQVRLLEREHFPRFHIGESLMPDTYWIMKRLGMLEKMKTSAFTKKFSVQFFNQDGQQSQPFYFFENNPHECSETWQVLRSEFDQMMLDNARSYGVDVREGARVLDVTFEGDRQTGVRVRYDDGTEETLHPKVVVDSSGQSSLISNKLKLRYPDEKLKKATVWSYFKAAKREAGKFDTGATLVLQTQEKKGWFWYIPQHNDIVSVGVVGNLEEIYPKDGPKRTLDEIFWDEASRCPAVLERIKDSERVDEYRTTKDFSYRSKKAAGPNWVLTGDAFGFLDPIYSSGLQLAFRSGAMSADAVAEAFETGDFSGEKLGAWSGNYLKGMDRIRQLVYYYYEGFNFGAFVRRFPDHKRHVTDLLIGDVFKDSIDDVWEPMAISHAECVAREKAEQSSMEPMTA